MIRIIFWVVFLAVVGFSIGGLGFDSRGARIGLLAGVVLGTMIGGGMHLLYRKKNGK